jgi:hypothetical protein
MESQRLHPWVAQAQGQTLRRNAVNTEIGTLREEYLALRGRVEMLSTVARTVGNVPLGSLQRGVEVARRFLVEDFLPLCRAENRAQYPLVGRLLGSDEAIVPMTAEVHRLFELVTQLRAVEERLVDAAAAEREASTLRAILDGLYELTRMHIAKEERVFLPLLDSRLTPDEAHRLVTDMYLAEEAARR